MYLHIGNNKNIRARSIIGIFDADTATVSSVTRRYLARADKEGSVSSAGEEIPKSFVLYRSEKGFAVCFSQLSTAALVGRSESKANI